MFVTDPPLCLLRGSPDSAGVRADPGQSTVEYVVLVLLAVLVLAAGAGLHATGIADAVVRQIRIAICRAGGDDCRVAPEPCIVASTMTLDDLTARVAVLRLRGGRTLVRERRSDGSERVTLVARGGGGAGLGLGADIAVGTWALGGRLDGAIELRGGRGRVWTLDSSARADALVRALSRHPASHRRGLPPGRRQRDAPIPAADAVFGERGLATSVAGGLQRVGLTLDAEDLLTTRTDRRTGERTLLVRRRTDLLGTLGVLGPLGAEGGARRDERAALVVDRNWRPLRLLVTRIRRVQGGGNLPGPLRALVARGGLPLRRGRVVEVERRLELAEPANLAAAGAFVRALRDPGLRLGAAVAVSDALRRRLDAAGETRLRVYDLDVRHGGAHGGIDVGVGLGAGYEHAVERLRLVGATERDGGGRWRERDDCLLGA